LTSITKEETEIFSQIERSNEYLILLEELKNSFVNAGDMVLRLYEQGKKDGLTNNIIRKDIVTALDGIVKERRLRDLLPLELKRGYTIGAKKHKANSAMIAELDSNPVPKNDEFGNRNTENIKEFNTEGMGVAIIESDSTSNIGASNIGAKAVEKVIPVKHEMIEGPASQTDPPSIIIKKLEQDKAILIKRIQKLEQELADYRRLPNNDALYNMIDKLKHEVTDLKKENAKLLNQKNPEEAANVIEKQGNAPTKVNELTDKNKEWLLEK
jgi:hypothetical protein